MRILNMIRIFLPIYAKLQIVLVSDNLKASAMTTVTNLKRSPLSIEVRYQLCAFSFSFFTLVGFFHKCSLSFSRILWTKESGNWHLCCMQILVFHLFLHFIWILTLVFSTHKTVLAYTFLFSKSSPFHALTFFFSFSISLHLLDEVRNQILEEIY